MRFKIGDIVKTEGKYFSEREIVGIDVKEAMYKTRFLDDDSIVYTNTRIIDAYYFLK